MSKNFADTPLGQTLWPIQHAHVSLLITTRIREIESELEGAKGFPLDRLDAESALELLLERARARKFSVEEQPLALRLASEELGGHPLAISLAGAYLGRVKSISLAQYREVLREKGLTDNLEEAAKEVGHTIRDHERSIVATYELSRKQLDPKKAVDALALRLLQLAAFLAPGTAIDPKLFERLLRASGQTADVEQIGRALARLTADLALLDDAGRDVIIHPLIADYTRWRILKEGERDKIQYTLLKGMRSLFPDSAEEFWRITRQGAHPEWEHLSVAREAHVAAVWNQTRTVEAQARTILSWCLGDLYLLRGSLSRAWGGFDQALAIATRLAEVAPENTRRQRDVLVCHGKLGDVLSERGDLEGARRSYEQALETAQRLAAREPENTELQRDVSVTLNKLGDVLKSQGNLEDARRAFEQDLEIAQRLAGRKLEDTG